MRQLTGQDLEFLSLGCAVLGSGGGGDPAYACLMAKYQLQKYGPVNLISLDDLPENGLVVPMAIMGAPLINKERLLSGRELEALLITIEKTLGRQPIALMPGEIGGANAFAPLLIAAKLGLPVLDADLIGRAFPKLQMNYSHLQNHNPCPAIIANDLGSTTIINTPDINQLEKLGRAITVSMGSSAAIALHLMEASEAPHLVLANSMTRALAIGEAIYEARERNTCPITALMKQTQAHFLTYGTLVDIQQEIRDGFLYGSATLINQSSKTQLFYQNEYLLASNERGILATTPDILILMEESTGNPITSETLKYGLEVALMGLDAPKIWQTPRGLTLVGPRVFGYDLNYQPLRRTK